MPTAFGNIGGDGRFEISGLAGPVRFALTSGLRGYRLKSIDIGAVNAVEEPAFFESARDSRTDVIATLSSDVATLSGRVTDDKGRDLNDYRVIVFSVDRSRWYQGSQNVQMTAGPNLDGGYTILDIPPGDYWVAAVDAVEGDAISGEWQTPEFLQGLAVQAQRVVLAERQTVRVHLRLIRRTG